MTGHKKPHHEVLECFQADCEQSGCSYSVLKLSNRLPPVGDITYEDSEQRRLIPLDDDEKLQQKLQFLSIDVVGKQLGLYHLGLNF